MQCWYVARNMTKCPLTRGIRLRVVSVSGGSTVFSQEQVTTVVQIRTLIFLLNSMSSSYSSLFSSFNFSSS